MNYDEPNTTGNEHVLLVLGDFLYSWYNYEHYVAVNDKQGIADVPDIINPLDLEYYSDDIKKLYEHLINYLRAVLGDGISSSKLKRYFQIGYFHKNDDGSISGEIKEEDFNRIINSSDYRDMLYFLLFITTKVRHRTFHGGKESPESQLELFEICTSVLQLMTNIKYYGRNYYVQY